MTRKPRKKNTQEPNDKTEYLNIRKLIKFKNESQKIAYDVIGENRITFLCGPAGTAKSFLSVAYALDLFCKGEIGKIVLTRPMIEAAGEKMGFLPGSLSEKIAPYLVPLFDMLGNFIDEKDIETFLAQKRIEICPLAFMRGRTIADAVIIADESQNMSFDQIKMLLSRIGEGSQIILTGDSMQSDLKSGCCFDEVALRLSELPFVGYFKFKKEDIVRDPIISQVLDKLEEIKK